MDSPIFLSFMSLIPIMLIFSMIWAILMLLKIKILRLKIVPLLIISLIPIIDSMFGIRFEIENLVRPKKLLVASYEGTSWGEVLNLRINNKFEFEVSTWTGTEVYPGEYIITNDTLNLVFSNRVPDIFGERPLYWVIDKNENKLNVLTDKGNSFEMNILRNDLR